MEDVAISFARRGVRPKAVDNVHVVMAHEGHRGQATQRVISSGGFTSDRVPVALQRSISQARRG
eukprot:9048007-Pyramimonas_sp.AAC.1